MATHVVRDHETQAPPVRQRWALWSAFLGPPVVWMAHFQAIYTAVDFACREGVVWPYYLSTGLAGVLVLACAAISARHWRAPWGGNELERSRSRFLGQVGVAEAVSFLGLIAAEAAAVLVFDPCER